MNTSESPIHELQVITSETLAKAARGELDLNKLARDVLANRGQNEYGKWVGFSEATRIHQTD